jgi:hypothetical protein
VIKSLKQCFKKLNVDLFFDNFTDSCLEITLYNCLHALPLASHRVNPTVRQLIACSTRPIQQSQNNFFYKIGLDGDEDEGWM